MPGRRTGPPGPPGSRRRTSRSRRSGSSDGIGHGGEAELARALLAHGPVTLVGPPETALALTPPRLEDGELPGRRAARRQRGARGRWGSMALGPDPNGIERVLGSATGEFAAGRGRARPRDRHAGGAAQPGGAGAARRGALGGGGGAGRRLGAPAQGRADVRAAGRRGAGPGRSAALPAQGAGAVRRGDRGAARRDAERGAGRADPGRRRQSRRGGAGGARSPGWRRAGCSSASPGRGWRSSGVGQLEEDPLLPVRLRAGGRSIGGAMSWGAPRRLQPFPESRPFAGLPVPEDVDISSQVMAQPDPDLPGRVLASLEDGTPLVTGRGARGRAGGALPRHRQRRLVEPAALGALRADAGAADPERRRPRRRRRRRWRGRSGRRCRCWTASGRWRRRAWSPGCPASGWPRRGRRRRRRPGSMPAASGGWR